MPWRTQPRRTHQGSADYGSSTFLAARRTCPYYCRQSQNLPDCPAQTTRDYPDREPRQLDYEARWWKVVPTPPRLEPAHHYTYSHSMDWNPNENATGWPQRRAGSATSPGYHQQPGRAPLGQPMVVYRRHGSCMEGWEMATAGWSRDRAISQRNALHDAHLGMLARRSTPTSGAAIVGLGPGIRSAATTESTAAATITLSIT